ncbi:MAG: cation:proton antiporter [Deltaproteobacteria bacterium]|nr:MAG: cation:proton antiporter [Deltaproteobacteria bacterium]
MRAPGRSVLRVIAAYAVVCSIAVVIVGVVCLRGEALHARARDWLPRVAHGAGGAGGNVLAHLLLGLLAILVAARLVGWAFARLRQPPVMGEVVAGILLGPSVLGALWPTGEAVIFPPVLGPYLAAIAQIGIVLYMFLVGLHLNPALFRGRTRAAVAVSHASIAVPFVLGTSLALVTYPQFSSSEVSFTSFALFSGVALSITAFPVLARILSDRRLHTSQLGAIALACAAADDVTAWCLLALVVGIAHAAVQRAVLTIVLALVYVAVMLLVGRPLVRRLVARFEHAPRMSSAGMSAIYIALLGSALATELIGIHALFGAFLVGAIVPPASRLARALCSRLEDLVTALLLPAFFAIAGLNTQIGLVDGASAWWTIALIIAAAFAGKFGGAFTAARLTGLGSAEAGALGIMMNTRGLMELIVLNIGLELGILSPVLYSMFVVMALATTLMTGPLLDALAPRITWSDGSMRERERVDAGRSALDPAALLDERAVAEHAGHHARADEDAHLELAGHEGGVGDRHAGVGDQR